MDRCTVALNKMPERTPTEGTFELTVRCNLHCKMCLFRHDDCENAEIMAKELTTKQWVDMARQVAEAGTLSLLITGGEPLLRPDFCEIWEGIYKYGFVITLYTNATLVTPKVMETLRKYPPHKIGVTIYGASPETYEKVTGNAEAFKATLDGIRQLITLPSRMEYRTTIIKDNFDDIEQLENLVRSFDSQATLINAQLVTKAVRGACADVESCRLSPGKYFEISVARGIRELKVLLGNRFDQGTVALIPKAPECDDSLKKGESSIFGCAAGMKSYTVSWDGNLLACQLMGSFSKTIDGDFQKAWNDFPCDIKLPKIDESCRNCHLGDYCALCPAFRFAETGSFSAVPEYLCANVKAVYKLLNIENV